MTIISVKKERQNKDKDSEGDREIERKKERSGLGIHSQISLLSKGKINPQRVTDCMC